MFVFFSLESSKLKNTSFWLYGKETQYLLVVLKVLKHESTADLLRHLHMFITLGCIYGFRAYTRTFENLLRVNSEFTNNLLIYQKKVSILFTEF